MSSDINKNTTHTPNNAGSASIDYILRPIKFEEYIGQTKAKKNLQTMISAAKKRNEPIDHLLFFGQAGLGKTTLAGIVSKTLGKRLRTTSGPILEKTGDLAAILSSLDDGDILFIDEAHRINRTIEEMLYPAMEARQLHLIIGKGPSARMVTIDLPSFTLIAATTRINLLSSPLRSRFGATFKLDYYTTEDIKKIIYRSANILGVDVDDGALEAIALASRFTPRVANRLLKRVRDVIQVDDVKIINKDYVYKTLDMFDIDRLGLEGHDRKLLSIILKKFDGGPVGLSTLSASLGDDRTTIEDIYEPYLLKMDFLERTSRGRVITKKAIKHLKENSKKH